MKVTMSFEGWMRLVDLSVQTATGVSVYDLTDCPFRDWYDTGVKARVAARRAVRQEKES